MTMNVLNTVVEASKKNMHLFILAIYAYVLFQIEENDYVTMVLLTVAACLAICYIKKGSVEGYTLMGSDLSEALPTPDPVPSRVALDRPVSETTPRGAPNPLKNLSKSAPSKKSVSSKKTVLEAFENAPQIMNQLPDIMGPYDGLCLQTGNKQPWMKTPDETALVPNDALFTYLSSQGPTKPVFTDNSALTGPSVDGHPDSDKKMFMLANNRTSPNCCPSTFSTSTGCVCTTKNQRDFVASRGGSTLKQRKTADLQDI